MGASEKLRELLLWACLSRDMLRTELEKRLEADLPVSGASSAFRFFERDVPGHGCHVEWREAIDGDHRILILQAAPSFEESEAEVEAYGVVQDRQMFPRVPPSGVVAYSIRTAAGRPGGIQYDSTGSKLIAARVEFGEGSAAMS